MCFFLFHSCEKELDITTTETERDAPEIGETAVLMGIVRDTSETPLPNVELRIKLDDFSTDITTDAEGYYEVEVPVLKEKGLLVADKERYHRAIQAVALDAYTVEKNIYLMEDQKTDAVKLDVNEDALVYLRGKVVDQFGQPIAGLLVRGLSLIDDDDIQYSTKTEADGSFEFIIEEGEYEAHFLFTFSYTEPCLDQLSAFRLPTTDTLLDFGTLEMHLGAAVSVMPDVAVTGCTEDYINHIYRPGDFNITEERLLPNAAITLCDTSSNTTELWVYNGVKSADNTQFNGHFQTLDAFEEQQQFDLCTPTGRFLELRTSTDTLLLTDFSFTSGGLRFQTDTDQWTINWSSNFRISSGNASSSFGLLRGVEKTSESGDVLLSMTDGGPSFVHFAGGNGSAAVLTAKVKTNTGDTEFITVRFRN